LLVQLQAGLSIRRRLFPQPDRPALTSLVADLHRAGIAQSFLDQEVSDFLRLAIRLEINCLDESIRALALICLGEANDCSTERRNRATLVVAMLPTELCCRYQECTGRSNVFIKRTHGGVKRFEPQPDGFLPGREIHFAEV